MITVNIITPEETVFEGEVQSLTLPTVEGEITVLGGHIPLITVLVAGTVIARNGSDEWVFACSRGVIEVDGKSVRVLADTADRAENLEQSAVEAAMAAAKKLTDARRNDAEGFAEASAVLDREIARLQTIHRLKRRGHSARR